MVQDQSPATEYVVIDFGNAGQQPQMSQPYRLIRLDTKYPFMQVDDQLYRGTWTRSVGTDLHYDADGKLVAKSTRRLMMRRVEVRKKDDRPTTVPARDRVIRAPRPQAGRVEDVSQDSAAAGEDQQRANLVQDAVMEDAPDDQG